jgi:hypothetical protein
MRLGRYSDQTRFRVWFLENSKTGFANLSITRLDWSNLGRDLLDKKILGQGTTI